jgi:CubicO group peptidase (beta-lactamase class C family)
MLDTAVLSSKLEALRKENNIAGLSVSVTDKNGLIFSQGFGVESVERPVLTVGPDTLFKIASISKVINAVTCMGLVDAGLLELDAPVQNYLPWFTLPREGAAEKITLRHLLSHGAGLDGKIVYGCPRDERFTVQTLQEILAQLPVHSLAGEGKFLYSNYGFVTASCMAAAVTGMPYSQAAKERTLDKLGMTHTFYHSENWCTYPVALPHVPGENGELVVKHRLPSEATRFGSGEVFSTTEDLCKLARLFLRGGVADDGTRLLKAETVETMMTPQIDRGNGEHHGLGLHIRTLGGHKIYGHTGWLPPYRGTLFFDPRQELGIAVLHNTDVEPLRDEILKLILG